MVVWVKDAPKFNENSEEEVTDFLDKYISVELPPETDQELHEIVSNVQMHSKRHTKSCRKGGKVCRFNFPKPPSDRTFICEPVNPIEGNEEDPGYQEALIKRADEETEAKETLKRIWELLEDSENSNVDWNDILHKEGLTQCEFEKCLSIVSRRQTVYLKRNPKD